MAKFGFDAFLSYASEDRELAKQIVEKLRLNDFIIWYDVEQIAPGESFRFALAEGLKASRHFIALLTPAYTKRKWTQREVDLFDLTADRTRRRILGIQVGPIKAKKIDQVFRVSQWIQWNGDGIDPAAFWLLLCGLKIEKPGPQAEWAIKGTERLSAAPRQLITPAPTALLTQTGTEVTNTRTDQGTSSAIGEQTTSAKTRETPKEDDSLPNTQVSPAVEVPRSTKVRSERGRTSKSVTPASASIPTGAWACVGPTNIGGRATCVVCHPTTPDIVWLGTAGGGVWKSEDCGKSWRYLWHRQDCMNVGSLAIDPHQPDTLYCGTGEINLLGPAGVGVFRSLNGGNTWSLLASVKKHNLPKRIGVVAIDPFDSKHICLGGVELTDGDFGGMHASHDGGRTWRREDSLSEYSHSCYSIVFHPARKGVIFATFVEPGFQSGIWRSIDGGRTWKHLQEGLPSADSFNRTSLAIAPSQPDVIYAIASNFNEDGDVLGVFVSNDMGSHWKPIGGSHFKNERHMMGATTIAVHPQDHRFVICGGEDLHQTSDAGTKWRHLTRWDLERGDKKYAHSSHNGLVMPARAPGRIYDVNNGGMDFSEDGGRHWINRSKGLAVTPYYNVAVAPSDSRCYGGGTDSNGVVVTTTGRPDDHFELLGGSAGTLVFDPKDSSRLLASYYNMNIYRVRGSRWTDITPPAPQAEKESVWVAVICMAPANPKTIFTGSYRLWRTRNDGQSWEIVSPAFDGSAISTIEVSKANPKRVFVGTEKGGVFRSLDAGESWSNNIAGASLPRTTASCIRSSPIDADVVFVSVTGFGRSHVFRSDDGARSWIDVDRGSLPDVPHHAIVIPDDQPGTVYVCNDMGVFVSTDLGNQWQDLTGNLPNTMIHDLVYHQDGGLYAATFGRSIWRLQVR